MPAENDPAEPNALMQSLQLICSLTPSSTVPSTRLVIIWLKRALARLPIDAPLDPAPVGVGVGVGLGDGEGLGDGLGDGDGVGDGDDVGEGDGVGLGDDVGEGEGDGEGLEVGHGWCELQISEFVMVASAAEAGTVCPCISASEIPAVSAAET